MALPNLNSLSNPVFCSAFQVTFISLGDDFNRFIDYGHVDVSDNFINIEIRQNEFFL